MGPFIVMWLLLGFIAAAMAASKKLNILACLGLGAVLGPIAILLVLRQAPPPPAGPWAAGDERSEGRGGSGTGGSGCSGGFSCGGGGCGGGGG